MIQFFPKNHDLSVYLMRMLLNEFGFANKRAKLIYVGETNGYVAGFIFSYDEEYYICHYDGDEADYTRYVINKFNDSVEYERFTWLLITLADRTKRIYKVCKNVMSMVIESSSKYIMGRL